MCWSYASPRRPSRSSTLPATASPTHPTTASPGGPRTSSLLSSQFYSCKPTSLWQQKQSHACVSRETLPFDERGNNISGGLGKVTMLTMLLFPSAYRLLLSIEACIACHRRPRRRPTTRAALRPVLEEMRVVPRSQDTSISLQTVPAMPSRSYQQQPRPPH
jgi:hypothetical protein